MTYRIVFLFLFLFMLSISVSAQGKTEKMVLDNGLTVLMKQDKSSPAVAVFIAYKVGSRNEQIGKTGISHLLEHIMFRGTEKYPEERFNNTLYALGAKYNAFTSYDVTAYHEVLPAAYLENALEIEADRMKNCAMTQDSVNKEQKIVLNELDMYDSNPTHTLFNELMNIHFRNHPYRWTVGGFNSDVAGLVRDDIVDHYKTYYVPNNAILVVAGNFEKDKAGRLINKYFATIPRGKDIPKVKALEPPVLASKELVIKRKGNTSYLAVVFPASALKDKDLYPLQVADAALTQGKSSRLYKALVDSGIASSVSSDLWMSVDPGVFSIMVALTNSKNYEEAKKIVNREIEALKTNPPSKNELLKIQNNVRANFIRERESIDSQAFALGYFWALGDENFFENYLGNIKKVKPEDIAAASKKYFDLDKCSVGLLLADGTGNGTGSSEKESTSTQFKGRNKLLNSKQVKDSKVASVTDSSLEFKFEKFRLDNGLTVIVKENASVPVVHMGGYIKDSGSFADKSGLEGVSSLTAYMLERGTKERKYEEIISFKDFNAVSLSFSPSTEATFISGWMLSEKFPEVMKLSSELLVAPVFPAQEFEKVKKQRISTIKRVIEDPSYQAIYTFQEKYYGKSNPAAHSPYGTVDSVSSLPLEELKNFYNSFYRPEKTVIVIVGDVKASQVKKLAQEYFGKWKAQAPEVKNPKVNIETIKDGGVREDVFINNKPQNVVVLGHAGVHITSSDYTAFNALNMILGGAMLNSRLIKDIRVDKGLVYYLYSRNIAQRQNPYWTIQLGVASENVDRAITDIKALLAETKKTGVTQKELDDTKSNVKNKMQVDLSDMQTQVNYLETMEMYSFPSDYISKRIESYEKLSLEDVNRVLRKYVEPDKMITVVAGSYKSEKDSKDKN